MNIGHLWVSIIFWAKGSDTGNLPQWDVSGRLNKWTSRPNIKTFSALFWIMLVFGIFVPDDCCNVYTIILFAIFSYFGAWSQNHSRGGFLAAGARPFIDRRNEALVRRSRHPVVPWSRWQTTIFPTCFSEKIEAFHLNSIANSTPNCILKMQDSWDVRKWDCYPGYLDTLFAYMVKILIMT